MMHFAIAFRRSSLNGFRGDALVEWFGKRSGVVPGPVFIPRALVGFSLKHEPPPRLGRAGVTNGAGYFTASAAAASAGGEAGMSP